MKRHPIRMLPAAALAAALLAPAAASAAPSGWTPPPPPPPGEGSAEVQTGTIGEKNEPEIDVVPGTGLGGAYSLQTLSRGSVPPRVHLGDPPADEPQDVDPPLKEGEEEQSIEDAIRERNRTFGDAAGDEAARREAMERIMRGIGGG